MSSTTNGAIVMMHQILTYSQSTGSHTSSLFQGHSSGLCSCRVCLCAAHSAALHHVAAMSTRRLLTSNGAATSIRPDVGCIACWSAGDASAKANPAVSLLPGSCAASRGCLTMVYLQILLGCQCILAAPQGRQQSWSARSGCRESRSELCPGSSRTQCAAGTRSTPPRMQSALWHENPGS